MRNPKIHLQPAVCVKTPLRTGPKLGAVLVLHSRQRESLLKHTITQPTSKLSFQCFSSQNLFQLKLGTSIQLVLPYYWAFAEVPITILSISLPAMMPSGHHLAKNHLSPLASKIFQLSVLASSTDRTRQSTKKNSGADGPAWCNSTENIILLPNDGGSGFGDRTSKDLTSRGLEGTHTVTAQVLSPNRSRTIPQNAIRFDNFDSISRRRTKDDGNLIGL